MHMHETEDAEEEEEEEEEERRTGEGRCISPVKKRTLSDDSLQAWQQDREGAMEGVSSCGKTCSGTHLYGATIAIPSATLTRQISGTASPRKACGCRKASSHVGSSMS
jgi:hypothetical protein